MFVDGRSCAALRDGSLLYVEEINRVPEETLNVLITVMSEGELHVPRLGRVAAAPGFRLVAAMNPFDAIGTARISSAVYDRVCRLSIGYQDAADETAIVARHGGAAAGPSGWPRWSRSCAARARIADLRIGSSVRGAIDTAKVAASLAGIRGLPTTDTGVGLDAALVALSGRIRMREGVDPIDRGRDRRAVGSGVLGRRTRTTREKPQPRTGRRRRADAARRAPVRWRRRRRGSAPCPGASWSGGQSSSRSRPTSASSISTRWSRPRRPIPTPPCRCSPR